MNETRSERKSTKLQLEGPDANTDWNDKNKMGQEQQKPGLRSSSTRSKDEEGEDEDNNNNIENKFDFDAPTDPPSNAEERKMNNKTANKGVKMNYNRTKTRKRWRYP